MMINETKLQIPDEYKEKIQVIIREEDKAVITKSFDELEAYKKKIGKCISKSMLQEFSKFSPKNILGL